MARAVRLAGGEGTGVSNRTENSTSVPVFVAHTHGWTINLTQRVVEEMHADRLEQLFAGLRMVSDAIAEYKEPSAIGEAKRAFEKRVRRAQ